jgi:hypothetical protein
VGLPSIWYAAPSMPEPLRPSDAAIELMRSWRNQPWSFGRGG